MDKVNDNSAGLNLSAANILVTGGAGFIGSNFIRYVLKKTKFQGKIINYDKLTYAGNLLSLSGIDEEFGESSYFFEQGDIRDSDRVQDVFDKHRIKVVVHFAAESHVDRSISGPKDFIETNVNGTFTLLEAAKQSWKDRGDVRFHHISTDEVYGSLGETGLFYETTPYDPRSPYSASKAASDHIVRAFYHTYGLPVTISNCSNNYGPYHFPEKLIPLIILNAAEGKALPVYGDGKNVRDWLYVEDHCSAIWEILRKGIPGETYNIGGECEKQNIEVVREICETLEKIYPFKKNTIAMRESPGTGSYLELVTFIGDRPGHDRRYAISCEKIKNELGWKQAFGFEEGLANTISWYLTNKEWVTSVRNGEYRQWISKNYQFRGISD